ncbi:MAG TPA: GNAT family N-acetyltransferase [Nocardioides sp.]|jgi:GNAT superfamily N-acetyltransferase|nr:GNAT family N-acetyltransferase [Nocardioides sp.]
MDLRFFDRPADFLDVAGDHLAAQPVLSTVMAGVADRVREQAEAGVPWPEGVPCWFAVALDADEVVGTAMRTARFGEYPAYLLPMPDDAAVLLARTLVERDEPVLGANGALPTVQVFCEEMARATGKQAVVGQHTRLFELGELKEPPEVPGRLRPAALEEQDLVSSWYDAFMADADEQAGRRPGVSAHETPAPEEMRHRIEAGRVFVWEDPDGTPVHVTAATMPSYGVSRVGPVFTPKEHRGRGIASRAVYEVSRLLRDSGERACLFTDQANPTSNKIYEALGYQRLVDMANMRVE